MAKDFISFCLGVVLIPTFMHRSQTLIVLGFLFIIKKLFIKSVFCFLISVPGLSPDFQERMVEYLKLFKIDVKTPITAEQLMLLRQSVPSPTRPTSPRDSSFNILDMSKLQMWNMFNNNTLYPGVGAHHQTFSPQPVTSPVQREPSPEPQREALDLGLR